MKLEYYTDGIISDWEALPSILIDPVEITNGSKNDFITIMKMYGSAVNAFPINGENIINVELWTTLKIFAYHFPTGKCSFVIGVKAHAIKDVIRKFIEIGIIDFDNKSFSKIAYTKIDKESDSIYTVTTMPQVTVKEGENSK